MSRFLRTTVIGGLAVAGLVVIGATVIAQKAHVLTTMNDAKWGPAPPLVPPGAQIAVLSGDPMKAVPYTVRFKFPANYVIPAHSHPADENVAITSGEFFMGMGDKLDKTHATSLPTGGYAMMPAGMNHFAFTKGEGDAAALRHGAGGLQVREPGGRSAQPQIVLTSPARWLRNCG